ncbi:UCH domain-containing protein [Cephalotus follicularis]|uniref:UCH domain-containing protein n=1 Tax=Cephalotus follicularis TaxID=3775 RepID=A0A1Q3CH99_CEPFO|nr:UCH domain-containing protein [Cephalotus follicularis]
MSFTDALSFHTSVEEISDVSCSGCGSKVTIRKKVLLFLIVHLKRFLSPEDKIKGHVDFPLSLNVAPYSSSTEDMDYDLYRFIVHAGEFASLGHYYTFIFGSSLWYRLNNEEINLVVKQEVLKQEAYICSSKGMLST